MIYVVKDYIECKCYNVDKETFIKLIMGIKGDNDFYTYGLKYGNGSFETIWAKGFYELRAISNKREMNKLMKELKRKGIPCIAKKERIACVGVEDKSDEILVPVYIVILILMIVECVTITVINICIKLGVIK